MASIITNTSLLNQGTSTVPLITPFQRNSITFQFYHEGITNSYATVVVNGISFYATRYQEGGTTDSYEMDMTKILPAFLGHAPTVNYGDRLTKTYSNIYINGYNSSGTLIAQTSHPSVTLCFAVNPIGWGAGLQTLYDTGISSGRKIYHQGQISFFNKNSTGSRTVIAGGYSSTQYLLNGYNVFVNPALNRTGTLSVSGTTISIPVIYRSPATGAVQVQWINKWGGWSHWYFRLIETRNKVTKSGDIPLYALTNNAVTGLSFEQNTDKSIGYVLDTIAVDDTHYGYLCEIKESPMVLYNEQVAKVTAISDSVASCRQNLRFNIELTVEENAVRY